MVGRSRAGALIPPASQERNSSLASNALTLAIRRRPSDNWGSAAASRRRPERDSKASQGRTWQPCKSTAAFSSGPSFRWICRARGVEGESFPAPERSRDAASPGLRATRPRSPTSVPTPTSTRTASLPCF